jgi:SAM-dependent methyltransferase
MKPDFGLTVSDYVRHRGGFPDSLYERLSALGVGRPSQELVDLGTGTGNLARGFARRGCRVVGVDISESMLAGARELDAREGVAVTYRVGRAEETGLDAASADVVTAGQCWHWFDRPQAARETARILRPDGRVVLCSFDWIPLPGNVGQATDDLIERHNPARQHRGGNGLHPEWLRDLGEIGYRGIESFTYDVDVPYRHEAWRGRIRASSALSATLPPDRVAAFDRELAAALEARFPGELSILHRLFVVLARRPR